MPHPVFLMCALALGCGEGLEPTSRITKERVIGVTSSVVGDETRTTPMAGERVAITLLTTQPGEPRANDWRFVVCAPSDRRFDVPSCDGGPLLAEFRSNGARMGDPSFVFEVPSDAEGDLLYFGALCQGGSLREPLGDPFNANSELCVDAGVPRVLSGRIRVRGPEGANRAPVIQEVRLRGAPWAPHAEPPGTCREAPIFEASSPDLSVIEVVPAEGSREVYEERVDGSLETRQEDLPVAFFSTERGISAFYSVIDDGRALAESDFDTGLMSDEDHASLGEGRLVRFEFVMRDERGGVDRETRFGCLVP